MGFRREKEGKGSPRKGKVLEVGHAKDMGGTLVGERDEGKVRPASESLM